MSVWSYGSEVAALGRRPDLMEASVSALAVTQLPPRLLRSIAPKAFVLVAAGGAHALAVASDGAVYAWGWNQYGQCGLGAESVGTNVPLPRAVPFLQMRHTTQIACGAAHSAVLVHSDAGGGGGSGGAGSGGGGGGGGGVQCYTFGAHAAGQLGRSDVSSHASPRPAEIAISRVELGISRTDAVSLMTTDTREVTISTTPPTGGGEAAAGDTGDAGDAAPIVPQPLACGAGHCAVLAADGTLWTWGSNQHGQCGQLRTDDTAKPSAVHALSGEGCVQVAW